MEVFLSSCIQHQQLGQESEMKFITAVMNFKLYCIYIFYVFLNSSAHIWWSLRSFLTSQFYNSMILYTVRFRLEKLLMDRDGN